MKRKKLLCLVLCFLMMNTLVACRLGNLSLLGKSNDGSKEESESTSQQEEEVYISNDVQAAYYHDFVNLIPFYEDVPYISIDGHGLYPKISYNQLSIVQNNWGEEFPYERLRRAYSYALSDIYVLNGRLQDEYEMAQFFYCNNSVSYMNGEELSVEEWNEYDGLLWYMTFLNYHCDIETEDDENGTLVHVKISNTDMVKLLYEELMNTQMMVKEDNQAAAAERMNGAFDHVKTYFKNQAENYDHIDHWDITHPAPGYYTVYPVYGNSLVSKLNLVQLAGGLIFEQAKYQKNREYWGNLSDDGTLYNYTLSNMLLRMADGDYDTVDTELTFYAEVDSNGNGYLPFDTRDNNKSFLLADQDWDSLVDILQSKGLASSNCSMGNVQKGDRIFSWGLESQHDYENMLFWAIMGWRGSVVEGRPFTDTPDGYMGYVGKVEPVTVSFEEEENKPVDKIEGESVTVSPNPQTGKYEVDGVIYEIANNQAKAVDTVENFSETNLKLPKEINGCPVTVIGEQAINGLDSLESVIIPEGIEVIESNAFSYNKNLVSVSLPTTLKELGKAAFAVDVALKEINIPDGIKVISEGCFLSCTSLEELVLPDSVEEVEYMAFDNCVSLNITVPKMAKCGRFAFRDVPKVNYK